MKIAMVFGKGLDGCGVQRGAVEIQIWAKKNGVQFDIFSLKERGFSRSKGHDMDAPREFLPEEMKEIGQELNSNYDIVILNSYPSPMHKPSSIRDFYDYIVKAIQKPVLVGMMHEIKKMNIDRIPMIIPILTRCDVVYNFSEKTWFSTEAEKIIPYHKLGDNLKRFKMWLDIDTIVDKFRNEGERSKRLIYVGRWTSMKDPRRVLDLKDVFNELDPEFQLALHGIERSIGAKADIIDHPHCRYTGKFNGYDWSSDGVQVFGPYEYARGMKEIGDALFASSFYRLPKEPHNYGDRMEYTQIEIIGCGAIPVFDKHFGENNMASNGKRYCDIPFLAVWSDREDLKGTAQQLLDIANDPAAQRSYQQAGLQFIRDEFDADKVLPEMFNDILSRKKSGVNSLSDDEIFEKIFDDPKAGKAIRIMLNANRIPAVGFKEVANRTISEFQKKKRLVLKYLEK